jgi:hypothetical protein
LVPEGELASGLIAPEKLDEFVTARQCLLLFGALFLEASWQAGHRAL